MNTPCLVIMAAGLGSRYGGLKQIAPVDDAGQIIIDYSIYDAMKAGFSKIICIIAPGMGEEFHHIIGKRIAPFVELQYAYQQLDLLPKGYAVPEGRMKPWGTAHAVLCAKDQITGPFAVINADDFYGRSAFEAIYGFLATPREPNEHVMVGYRIENTLTEHGHVARGVCEVSPGGALLRVVERVHIEPRPTGAAYTEDGVHFTDIPNGTVVSMNLWGFQHSMLAEIEGGFSAYLQANLPSNPLKCEYFLPLVVNRLLREEKAGFQVLATGEKWYGVTYQQDMPQVQSALSAMRKAGFYPEKLWRS